MKLKLQAPKRYGQVFAMVDDADFDKVNRYRWYLQVNKSKKKGSKKAVKFYGRASFWDTDTMRLKNILLHRYVMDAADGVRVDHISGDSLDCRRSNLRYATAGENSRNARKTTRRTTSRYKGVSRIRPTRRWRSEVCLDGTSYWLGSWPTERLAALAYNFYACLAHGDFACLNDLHLMAPATPILAEEPALRLGTPAELAMMTILS